MEIDIINLLLISCVFLPLVSGVFVGLFVGAGKLAHRVCIGALGLAFCCAIVLSYLYGLQSQQVLSVPLYRWVAVSGFSVIIGLQVDGLVLAMVSMITSISLLIHIYSVAYMHEDQGYVRFFSLLSLFTFSMLFLVASNNVIGLFFGWEGVSLFSYFLIGFYYYKDSAASASIKAFLINRFGDCAFCLGIILLIYYTGSADYLTIFSRIDKLVTAQLVLLNQPISVVTLIGLLLLIGAMTKSAQMPLHIWLPDSMEGPTPVSALLHAATMVTAGIYLLSRFCVVIEQSLYVQNILAFVGASGALFLGLLALCEMDIKRIIAYSTLSQLGYMMLAVGVGGYQLAIFHLIVHAFFKACLFMAAGSVILALDHEQNISRMGGLWRPMPLTAMCFLLSALSLSGIPPFAGFNSKDLILAAVHHQYSYLFAGEYIYYAALSGFLITPLYIFRLFWIVFVGPVSHGHLDVYESPRAITLPMFILAVMSVFGSVLLQPILVGHSGLSFIASSGYVVKLNSYIDHLIEAGIYTHAIAGPGVYVSLLGVLCGWLLFYRRTALMAYIFPYLHAFNWVLENKYGLDWVNDRVLVPFLLWVANVFALTGEQFVIDRTVEYRVSRPIRLVSEKFSRMQTSLLTRYFLIMIIALGILMGIASFRFGFLLRGL